MVAGGSDHGDGVRALSARRRRAGRRQHAVTAVRRRLLHRRGVLCRAPCAAPGAPGRHGGHHRERRTGTFPGPVAEPAHRGPRRDHRLLLLAHRAHRTARDERGGAHLRRAARRLHPLVRGPLVEGREQGGGGGGVPAGGRRTGALGVQPAGLPGGHGGTGSAGRAEPGQRGTPQSGGGTGAHRPRTARPGGPSDHPGQRAGHGRRPPLRHPPGADSQESPRTRRDHQ